jgi:hypothetical protein
LKVIILGLFFILFLGSLYFSLERILYADSSFILFRVINTGELQPQQHRFGSFITQGFPLIASKLHLPISWIVLIYSASFNLFYLAVAMILVLKLKEYRLALLMAFYFTLFVSDTFYWATNEVHQAISWMFLFFGLTLYFYRKKLSLFISLPVCAILAFLGIYTHPLVLFPIIFLQLFFLWEERKQMLKNPFMITITLIVFAICVSKFFISTSTDQYDYGKLHDLLHSNLKDAWRSMFTPFTEGFVKQSGYNYWIIPLLVIVGFYTALKKRKYLQLGIVIAFSIAYFLAMAITFVDYLPFYTESELMPWTIILATPFVYFTLPGLKTKTAVILLSLIFLVRLFYIGIGSEKFIERKNWIFSLLQGMREKNIPKAFVNINEINRPYYLSDWSTPQESMIASALHKDKPQLTFIVGNLDKLAKRIDSKKQQMLGTYELWGIDQLNNYYFSFDTTSIYQMVKLDQLKKK